MNTDRLTNTGSLNGLSGDQIEGMVAYYRNAHALVPCAGCSGTVIKADSYRCVDCDQIYHRHCLRQHCAGELEQARLSLTARVEPGAIVELLRPMKDHDRLSFMDTINGAYCVHCGSDAGYRCVCMKDE